MYYIYIDRQIARQIDRLIDRQIDSTPQKKCAKKCFIRSNALRCAPTTWTARRETPFRRQPWWVPRLCKLFSNPMVYRYLQKYVFMYVCMYVCMYIYIYIHAYIHIIYALYTTIYIYRYLPKPQSIYVNLCQSSELNPTLVLWIGMYIYIYIHMGYKWKIDEPTMEY